MWEALEGCPPPPTSLLLLNLVRPSIFKSLPRIRGYDDAVDGRVRRLATMGFFTRKDKVKQPSPAPTSSPPKSRAKLKQQESSFFDPPNVYTSRGTTYNSHHHAAPQPQARPYRHRSANVSSPQLALPAPPTGHQCQPVIVNQHYYINQQPQAQAGQLQPYSNPYENGARFGRSMANLARDFGALPTCDDGLTGWYGYTTNLVSSTVNACDEVASRLNNVLTLIDGEHMKGHEMDLFTCRQPLQQQIVRSSTEEERSGKAPKKIRDKDRSREREKGRDKDKSKSQTTDVAASVVKGNYFSKVELYANSKLPKDVAPFAVYVPTWPLLCLAAQYSLAVYERPAGAEREAHVSADWRTGSKAMCIKSVPMDHMHTIVFAIRGTASFMDWAVNLNTAPAQPKGFLDDQGNLCHAGFLSVARKMVKPVSARLRQLLQEDPSRSRYSLLITGHSAGGAVAALLYAHMLAASKAAESELNVLTGSFKRVHCVTFGTPPVSLLPITKPDRPELKNSVFLSFVNEGDPVTRADKAYVKSLLELLASPAPESTKAKESKSTKSKSSRSKSKSRSKPSKPKWPVPPCSLSNAGRIVVLRSGRSEDSQRPRDRMTVRDRLDEGVVANVCREDQLRGLIWGDPVEHLMKLYAGRIETLAVQAVTVGGRREKSRRS